LLRHHRYIGMYVIVIHHSFFDMLEKCCERTARLSRGANHIPSVFIRYFLALFSIASFLYAFRIHRTSPRKSAVIRRRSLLRHLFTRPTWIRDQVTHWNDHHRQISLGWHVNKRCKFELSMERALRTIECSKLRILSDVSYWIIPRNIVNHE